jgi:hypothetical protein
VLFRSGERELKPTYGYTTFVFPQLTGQIHNPEKAGACFFESVSFKVLFWFFGLTRE